MKTSRVTFNLHTFHNPDCDILEYQLDEDTKICYGIYVNPTIRFVGPIGYPIPEGSEFMEVYVGANYNVGSTKRSYSRCYYLNDGKLPAKHYQLWKLLKAYFEDCKDNGIYQKALKEGRSYVSQ